MITARSYDRLRQKINVFLDLRNHDPWQQNSITPARIQRPVNGEFKSYSKQRL